MRTLLPYAAVAAGLLLSASVGMASQQSSSLGAIESKPGEGVLCLWALTSVAAEVAKHCPGKRNPEFQAVLDESVSRMDQYVAANGNMSAKAIDEFKRRQGGVGQDVANLCSSDALQLYDGIHSQGSTALRDGVSKVVARPGTPAWGDCL